MKQEKYRFFVTDLYAHGAEHSLFAEAFINYFDKKDSVFLLNNVHMKFCSTANDKNKNFVFTDDKIKNRKFRLFNREIIKFITFLAYIPFILFSKRKVCILGASNLQVFFLSFLSFLKFRIVIHGQAEALLKGKQKKSLASRMFVYGFKRLSEAGTKFLFLSHHIKKNIDDDTACYFIKHPLPSGYGFSKAKVINTRPLRLAMVGLLRNDKKNSNLIYDLKPNSNVELWAIGRAHGDFLVDEQSDVKFKLWDYVYSNDEFEAAIKDIDGFIYLFNNDQYKMTASATALDAIIHQKIVFTLKNDAIESLLESYPYVYSADSIEHLSNLINSYEQDGLIIDSEKVLRDFVLGEKNDDTKIVEEWTQ